MENQTLINKKVIIIYNDISNDVTRDEGTFHHEDATFVVLLTYNNKLKYISKSKIVRIEEVWIFVK